MPDTSTTAPAPPASVKPAPAPGQHQRTSQFLLSGFEKAVLPRLAAALPSAVKPDHLTILGLLASTGIGASYCLTNPIRLTPIVKRAGS